MKITIEVSDRNEGTSSPWWMIINPKQNMSKGKDSCYVISDMITGPFFSREEAQKHLDVRRYAFGPNAVVYCHSGCWSRQYDTAYREAYKNHDSKESTK